VHDALTGASQNTSESDREGVALPSDVNRVRVPDTVPDTQGTAKRIPPVRAADFQSVYMLFAALSRSGAIFL
jgi:hypothetical protein